MEVNEEVVKKEKTSFVRPFKDLNYLNVSYYILSILVLFLKVFTSRIDNTYRIGLFEFASGFGWFYYIATIAGLLISFLKPLKFLENIAPKVISVVNLVVSLVLLLKTIPEALGFTNSLSDQIISGSIASGFWSILLLHILAVLVFYFAFIKSQYKKHKAKAKNN